MGAGADEGWEGGRTRGVRSAAAQSYAPPTPGQRGGCLPDTARGFRANAGPERGQGGHRSASGGGRLAFKLMSLVGLGLQVIPFSAVPPTPP